MNTRKIKGGKTSREYRIIQRWIDNNDENEPLVLNNLHLEVVPRLPNNVKDLRINNNNIKVINNLPQGLKHLFISNQ